VILWDLDALSILHLPFWNSFPREVNSFPGLQNIKELEAVDCLLRANPYFHALSVPDNSQ
jgi:hypothetical protein